MRNKNSGKGKITLVAVIYDFMEQYKEKLYIEILAQLLSQEEMRVAFPNLQLNAKEIIETECYCALQQIQAIIQNDDLSDFDCMEAIVRLFEKLGSDGGTRHDF